MDLLVGWLPQYIINKITALPPPSNNVGIDVRCYMENVEGNITVAELYNNLCGFDDDNHDVEWKRIWKLHVPERVRFLTWLMKHGRLLTNSHKSMMGLGSAMRGYCRDIPKTILHALLEIC
jgi:hypothetical protein